MDWKGLFKEWRIIVLLLAIAGSIIAIGPHYEQNEAGEVVIATNLKRGLDFTGGHRTLLAPAGNETFEEGERKATKDVLKNRVSAFGLKQMRIYSTEIAGKQFIQVEASGINGSDLRELLNKEGRFEAKMPIKIEKEREITLYGEDYLLSVGNKTITVDHDDNKTSYNFSETFKLHDIPFTYYRNRSANTTGVTATVYTGQQGIIKPITTGPRVRIGCDDGDCFYKFPVKVRAGAARDLKQVASNFAETKTKRVRGGTREYIKNTDLRFYLDGSLEGGPFDVQASFRNDIVKEPVLTGDGGSSEQQAKSAMHRMQSILRSGKAPVGLDIVSAHETSQATGEERFRLAMIAILLTVPVVTFVIFLRYRRPEIVLPVAITGFSEVLLIFGLASAIGWTIDLTAIAGIVAALGSGVDDQLIITDESSTKEIKSLKKKIKRAFFIIFTAAASTIGVMLPLGAMFAGFIQGFAITTMLGAIIGVTITRPAYAKIIEYID